MVVKEVHMGWGAILTSSLQAPTEDSANVLCLLTSYRTQWITISYPLNSLGPAPPDVYAFNTKGREGKQTEWASEGHSQFCDQG